MCLSCELEFYGPIMLLVAFILVPTILKKARSVRKSPEVKQRRTLASLLVCEAVLLCIGSLGAWRAYDGMKSISQERVCENNVRALTYAAIQYMADNDEKFPPADHWSDLITPYLQKDKEPAASSTKDPIDLKHVFQCPAATSLYGYGFNKALDKRSLASLDDPTKTIVFFETDAPSRNYAGGRAALVKHSRHHGWDTFGTADGNVSQLNPLAPDWLWLNGSNVKSPAKKK